MEQGFLLVVHPDRLVVLILFQQVFLLLDALVRDPRCRVHFAGGHIIFVLFLDRFPMQAPVGRGSCNSVRDLVALGSVS